MPFNSKKGNKKSIPRLIIVLTAFGAIFLFAYFVMAAPIEEEWTIQQGAVNATTCNSVDRVCNSLASWEDAADGTGARNLVTEDKIVVAKIDGVWTAPDTTTVTIDGWTTDATHYIKIYTTPEARHAGKWDVSKYRLETTNASGISISEDYVRIEGLQIKLFSNNSSNYSGVYITASATASEIMISLSIVRGDVASATGGSKIGIWLFAGNIFKAWNNIIHDFTAPAITGVGVSFRTFTNAYIYNNTVVNNISQGFTNSYGGLIVAKNNIIYNNTDNYAGSFNSLGSNNLSGPSSDAQMPSSNSKNGATVSFVDSANGDFHLALNDVGAKDFGTDLSLDPNISFNTDIDNETRSGTWDIGADEYAGVAPVYQCSDLIDNDADGLVDLVDPGCSLATDNDEYNAPVQTDATPPVRSAGSPTGALASSTTQTNLSLTTNESATCKYSTIANTAYSSMTGTFSTTGATNHSTTITGLQNGQSYNYYVRCADTVSVPNVNGDDFGISFSVASVAGKTINVASCSYADVSAAISSASAGDTISVPAGNCTWISNLVISKSVRLVGAGMDVTTITNGNVSYIISIIPAVPADDPFVEVTGFTFDGTGGSCMLIKNENTSYDFTRFRIHGNKFQNAATDKNAIYTRGMVFGLIDNNVFTGNFYDLNIRGYDWNSWDKYTKDTDNTLTYDSLGMGGARFLYVENNTFSDTSRFIVSSGEGARWVVRHNTLKEDHVQGFFDIHGDTNNDGNVAVEIYDNTQTTVSGTGNYYSSMWVDYRGGTSVVYNNSTFVDPGGARTSIKIREETSPCSALRKGYDMRIHNGYIWNNKNSKNNDNMYQVHHGPTANYDIGNCLSVGVDYWSDIQDDTKASSSYFITGLSSARPVNCSAIVPADVYWETDTKKLYRCTAENTWTFQYTPYTYPHPLVESDTTAPARSSGFPTGALAAGTTQTTISLTTNENATCKYSTTANTAYLSMTGTFSTTGATNHSTTITGLQNGQSYNYYVRCADTASVPNVNGDDFIVSFSVASTGKAAADFFDWSVRTDRDGKPAGIYANTPFPVDENSSSYSIKNDENSDGKIFYLGNKFFVDGGYVGGSNDGSWSYPWTSLTVALANVSAGNNTIIIRGAHDGFDGNYNETNLTLKSGLDDTHRFMLVGYGQERPIISGASASNDTIVANGAVSYSTLQRVKVQDNLRNGVRTANDDSYLDFVDVWLYNNDRYDGQMHGDGNLYFLGSDHCWIIHSTSEHTYGHGFKIGDGAENTILEWSVAKDIGYWEGFPLNSYYGSTATGINVPNDIGDSDGDGQPDRGRNEIIRYNIVDTALYYGVQLRRTPNFSFHHNEVKNTNKFDVVDMSVKGEDRKQIAIINEETYGDFYSNVIHDPGSNDAVNISIVGCDNTAAHQSINIYNNLLYGGTHSSPAGYGAILASGIKVGYNNVNTTLNIFSNSIYGEHANSLVLSTNGRPTNGDVNFINNIFYQAGSGKSFNFNGFSDWTAHHHNLYWAPQGTLGITLGQNESNVNPQWSTLPQGNYSTASAYLSEASPAIDSGMDLGLSFNSSLNGESRPQGSAWDIGAYEYIGGSTPTDTTNIISSTLPLYLGISYSSDALSGVIDDFAVHYSAVTDTTISNYAGCYNLAQSLVPEYLGTIPTDPSSKVTDGTDTGYFISKDPTKGTVFIFSPLTEITSSVQEMIKASR